MTLFSRAAAAFKSDSPLQEAQRAPTGSWSLIGAEGSIELTDSTYASYAYLYESQPWVQVCVNKLVRGMSRLPIKAFQRNREDRERLTAGSLVDLLKGPVPRLAPFAWKSAIIGNVALYGNCIAIKVQESPESEVLEIWPFSPVGWVFDQETDEYIYKQGPTLRFAFPVGRFGTRDFGPPTKAASAVLP